uniref:Uncharacterized protein n=1 Tax=Oryza sativa subsp. japonica TaxID=39947 RepID=Q5VPR7_ORYSJ|nr:hypothetical protein [Oryza sativa Japonica Group]
MACKQLRMSETMQTKCSTGTVVEAAVQASEEASETKAARADESSRAAKVASARREGSLDYFLLPVESISEWDSKSSGVSFKIWTSPDESDNE